MKYQQHIFLKFRSFEMCVQHWCDIECPFRYDVTYEKECNFVFTTNVPFFLAFENNEENKVFPVHQLSFDEPKKIFLGVILDDKSKPVIFHRFFWLRSDGHPQTPYTQNRDSKDLCILT